MSDLTKLIKSRTIRKAVDNVEKAKKKVERNQKFLNSLVNSLDNIIYVFNLKGILIKWNDSFRKLSGYSDEELGKMKMTSFFTREESNKVVRKIDDLVDTHSVSFEAEFLTRSADRIPMVFSASLMEDPDGEIVICGDGFDISNILKIKNKLQESESKFRKLIENMQDALIIFDHKGKVLFSNDSTARLVGLKKGENVISKNVLEFIHKDSLSKVKKDLKLTRAGEVGKLEEYKIVTVNGKIKYVELLDTLINFEGDKRDLAIIRDITKRKKLELESIKNRKKYENIFEHANSLIQSVDKQGNIQYVNKKWMEVMGYSEKEIKKLNLQDILRKDQIPHCMKIFKKILKGDSKAGIKTVFITKKGKEVDVEGSASPLIIDNKFVSTIGIFNDISNLLEREKLFEDLFNCFADPALILDKKGKILEINKGVTLRTGFDKSELLNKNVFKTKLLSAKEKVIAIKKFAQRMAGKKLDPYPLEIRTKKGKKLLYEINGSKVNYKNKTADLLVFRNISKRK